MHRPMLTFDVTVVAVEQLSPTFTRVTFGGASLADLHRCGPLGPRDLRVKLLIAADGSGPAPAPDFDRPHWQTHWRALDESARGVMRTYTIRRVGEDGVDIDFVLHEAGPASTWATKVKVGDPMRIIGPNRNSEWYGGIEWRPPLTPTRVLLVGDETALPAIGSILGTLPSHYTGHVVVEVPSRADFLPLESSLEVRYVERGTEPRGDGLLSEVARLVEASKPAHVEDIDVDEDLLWEVPERAEVPFYAWVAGEAAVVRRLRRFLVQERGVDRRAVAFMGYWRDGRAERS